MNPIIFDKNETSFSHNGYGRLFPISCKVEEERNGRYEAELEVTDSDKHYGDIELGSILGLKVSDGSTQLFRIYKINKIVDDVIRINAAHISYDLSYIPVAPIQNALGIQEALTRWKSNSLVSNPFNIDTDIVSEAAYSMNHPLSARAYLGGTEGSFLDKWHGEYEFDNYDVFLHESRGSNNGITIRYGKNLTSLEDEESIEDSADGILPYWTDGRFYVMGSIARKSQGNKILSIDVSADITLEEGQTMPTVEEVNSKGAKYLTALVTGSKQNIRVSWYEDNSISDVQLCDIVNVIYDPYSINVEMKVTKTIWNVLEEHYEEVELGEYRSFVKTLSEMSTDISNLKYNDNQLVVRLERTEDGIEAEVTRASTEEERLSNQINITAGETRMTVAQSVKEWNVFPYSITLYDYKVPTADEPKASDHINEYYLNQATGIIYRSNGSSWVYVKQCDSKIDEVQSEIDQLPNSIKLSVASSQEIWDESNYNISVYGYGSPTLMSLSPSDYSYSYYLDQEAGQVYYSNGSTWSYVTQLTSIIAEVNADLSVKINNTDYGTIVGLIEGYADYINFNANKLFTINSENLIIDGSGLIKANNIDLNGTTSFHTLTKYYNSSTGEWTWTETPIGYMGLTTVGDATGLGIRNDTDNGAVVIGPTTGNLWLKGHNNVVYLGDLGLVPWSSNLDLGYSVTTSIKRWGTLYCTDIDSVVQPWSGTSDKRLKNIKGDIEDYKTFYMALEPVKYELKTDEGKMRYGLIAQDVLKTYEKCYNSDEQDIVAKSGATKKEQEIIGEEEKYIINYNELHAFHIAMIQDLQAEIESLKSEIESLRKEIKR